MFLRIGWGKTKRVGEKEENKILRWTDNNQIREGVITAASIRKHHMFPSITHSQSLYLIPISN